MAEEKSRALTEIDDLFDEIDQLLKNVDVESDLAARGVNVSLAIVAADGLRAYLRGDKARAADDLGTVAEEILARLGGRKEGMPS